MMRAERDEDYMPVRYARTERRMAYEIAYGIWLGGIALAATSAIFWLLFFVVITGRIRLG